MLSEQEDRPAATPPAPPRRRLRWWRWLAGAVLGIVAILLAALAVVDTQVGHRWVADQIGRVRTANGLRFAVGRIDGSLYGEARLADVRVYDLDGLVFQAPRVTLDWRPWRWIDNRLDIRRLAVPEARLLHVPRTRPSGRRGPILPDFDIAIGALSVDRLVLAPAVLGQRRTGRLQGRADIRRGRALVALDAVVEGSDRLRLNIDAEPDRDRFDMDVVARGAARGVLARMVGAREGVTLDVTGDGRWARWRGRATARIGAAQAMALRLSADAGSYALDGSVAPAPLLKGRLQQLTLPGVRVRGRGHFAERRLDGTLTLRSAALAIETQGMVDLGQNAFRNLKTKVRLLRPAAVLRTMRGEGVELRLLLDGPFAGASFEYRLFAKALAFDRTVIVQPRAAGRGRWSRWPVTLPVRFTAAAVGGVGNVAGGILRNLSIDGPLRLTPRTLSGDALRLRSDKLSGTMALSVDLATGRYEVGLNGRLGRYLIPGLGIVEVTSRLSVVPGPGGRGTRVVGQGAARVLRLDNAFFRSLAGGLPRLTARLERTPDGVLHFADLVLVAPSLRLRGQGYRRRDGSFHFEGGGQQSTYGPVRLVLDGDIARPRVELLLATPNAALGLRDVRARLEPTPQGFAYTAEGGSRGGPFRASGAILLPRGGQAAIVVDALDVRGARGQGRLNIVPGGFDGRLDVSGGGWGGALTFRPVGDIQRIEGQLRASNVQLGGGALLRQGRTDFAMMLDPAGVTIGGTASGQGLRRGRLSLGRFAVTAKLTGGSGEIRAAIAGSRGRAFDIQTVIGVSPDRYVVSAQGTLDRRPLRLLTPATITRDGAGWRLAQTQLSFSGGAVEMSGRFGGEEGALEASLTRMPLAVLDIGYPGLGLGGNASGTIRVATHAEGAPTGRVDLTVRGLTRSGLVLSSRPIDMGLAGVLSADRLGVRAVMASGGRTIGRGQALLQPLGSGDLGERLLRARLFAQLRYAGPADTLWRLTGIEMFDLSGPVAIGADVSGQLAAPVIRGALQANGARIESGTTGTVLTNVQANGRFDGSRLVIDRFGADAGRGGRVTGTGAFDFAARGGVGMDLTLQADRAVMIARDDIGATVSGPLSFVSDGSGGRITGDVVLNRSRYRLGQASAATAVPKLAVREINVPGGGVEDEVPSKPWTLAVKARAPGQLMVSGLGLSSEWSADLQIGGEPTNPAITGQATLIRGDYEFAGREFNLDRGVIRFGGEVPANPALDIVANANVTGLTASIRVTGTGLKPEIGFSSTPALPEDELLSRLLFGTSITNLSAPEALQLAAAVAALQDGGNGLNPINAVRRAAGLDRLRVLPADPQTGQGTSVAAGKFITRRFYAEIVSDGQGYSATRVEFQVTRWLSLLSSISTLGRQSANVRVSRDY
ncbi:translocation/assembly module TamB domain-containing protein [Sphingomonas sp.]|uniref:translocation/assembly module TamB domain-containing protein n=1 Tax=Sphingomonas sp. TaxID=28214 RepID=UPI0035B1DF2B